MRREAWLYFVTFTATVGKIMFSFTAEINKKIPIKEVFFRLC
jgi:hypothetical protein